MLFFPKKFSVLQIRFFGNFASYKKSHHCVTFQKVIFFFWFVTQWFVCVCTQWFGTQKGIIVLQTCPAVSHIWSRTDFRFFVFFSLEKRHHCVTNLSRGVPYLEPHRFPFFFVFFSIKKRHHCVTNLSRGVPYLEPHRFPFFFVFFSLKKRHHCVTNLSRGVPYLEPHSFPAN